MAKKSRYLQAAERDLAKAVRSFNQIVSRAIKSGRVPEAAAPVPESVRKIKQAAREMTDSEKRAYYREQIRILKKIKLKTAFDVVESENGAKTTKFEKRRAEKAVREENKRRAERLAALRERPVQVGGKTVKGAQKIADESNLQPIKFDFRKKTKQDWEDFKRAYKRYEKPKGALYLRQLKKAADDNLLPKYARLIKEELDKIGASGLDKAYKQGYEFADLDQYYEPGGHSAEHGEQLLRSARKYRTEHGSYFEEWLATLRTKYTEKHAAKERREDFLRDARRFGREGLARAFEHGEKWAHLEFHKTPTRAKLYETLDGIKNYF